MNKRKQRTNYFFYLYLLQSYIAFKLTNYYFLRIATDPKTFFDRSVIYFDLTNKNNRYTNFMTKYYQGRPTGTECTYTVRTQSHTRHPDLVFLAKKISHQNITTKFEEVYHETVVLAFHSLASSSNFIESTPIMVVVF